jgi:putative methionine-R-sulfoxide reductase with GAF domain
MASNANPGLTELTLVQNVEEQCSILTNWLKQHYNLDVIGFLLKVDQTTQPHFFSHNDSMNMARKIEALLAEDNFSDEIYKKILFFSQNGETLDMFGSKDLAESTEIIGIAVPLQTQEHSIGSIALSTGGDILQDHRIKPEQLPFLPTVSSFLENALSHELKNNKIRLLNLYQTVSSSLAYIGDLQELLTTITGIVTSELFCEESSVLFYNEDTNEFEFFTAFGETGMELMSTRFPADRGIAGRALKQGKTQLVNDCKNDPDFFCAIDEESGFQTKSIISAPLISGDEKVGIINAVNKLEGNLFTKEDDQVLSAIADEVALAVKHARLFEYVIESYCKIRQGLNSCKGCKRPLKSWTPCVRQIEMSGL